MPPSESENDEKDLVELAQRRIMDAEEARHIGKYEEAIRHATQVVEMRLPDGPLKNLLLVHAHVSRGRSYVELKKHDVAIEDFTKAIRIDPESHLAFLHRAMAWEACGEADQALDDYSNAIRLNPENDEARSRAEQAKRANAGGADELA